MGIEMLVFHACEPVTQEREQAIKECIANLLPDVKVIVCGPGDTVSMPMDTRHLSHCVDKLQGMVAALVEVNQQLLAGNQQMLVDLLDMARDGDVPVNPVHHLGMSVRG